MMQLLKIIYHLHLIIFNIFVFNIIELCINNISNLSESLNFYESAANLIAHKVYIANECFYARIKFLREMHMCACVRVCVCMRGFHRFRNIFEVNVSWRSR